MKNFNREKSLENTTIFKGDIKSCPFMGITYRFLYYTHKWTTFENISKVI